jgi:repressor LexA
MRGQGRELRHKLLEFVEAFVQKTGYPPTYDEIRKALQIGSKSHVHYLLESLERDGLIKRTPRTPRGLRVVGQVPRSVGTTFEVGIEGYIAAGQPVEQADRPDEQIELTPEIADPRRDLYALRVQGDSMIDALVGDGDLLIVERKAEAARGQMAVVHLRSQNAATLKYLYPEDERVRLQPAHPTLPAFHVPARDVQVQGRVVAIVRRF